MLDWSNTVDVSAYYGFGKLIPASSITGENIIFTPDASGVGKTVKQSAKFYQAATANTAANENTLAGTGGTVGTGTLNATAHFMRIQQIGQQHGQDQLIKQLQLGTTRMMMVTTLIFLYG